MNREEILFPDGLPLDLLEALKNAKNRFLKEISLPDATPVATPTAGDVQNAS